MWGIDLKSKANTGKSTHRNGASASRDNAPYAPKKMKTNGVTPDTAARHQNQSELREAEVWLTSMLDTVDVGTWSVDLVHDRVKPDRNLIRMFFLTEEQAHGSIQNYLRMIHPEDLRRVEVAMAEVFANPNTKYKLEYRVVGPGGTIRWIDIRGSVERDPEGKPVLFRGVVLDVSERKSEEELQNRLDLSHRLLAIQDQERRRIARELHDSAGQLIAALSMNIGSILSRSRSGAPELVKTAEESCELVQILGEEIRTLSYLLHPPLLDELGLQAALRCYLEGLNRRSGLKVNLEISEGFLRLDENLELVLFKVIQECLTNVYRHSGSETASIRLGIQDGEVHLQVADEGTGMSPEKLLAVQTQGSGVGVQGMRERVRQVGGRMEVRSNGRGTRIVFRFPAKKPQINRNGIDQDSADSWPVRESASGPN
ncbi:MAG: hypothetical protein PVS2B2_13470 [Candidatus Acidiferrum sp.]